jgi:hypothetical protein
LVVDSEYNQLAGNVVASAGSDVLKRHYLSLMVKLENDLLIKG